MLRLERLCEKNSHHYERAYNLYQSAFPREEKRDSYEQARAMKKSDYHFDMIFDGEALVGVMLYWETDSFVFLEHFTTFPELRGNGYGARALSLLKAKGKTVILEIEPPEDELTTRRYNFYLRSDFVMNSHYHIQAKYHLGDPDLELKIMSYPAELSQAEYLAFYDYMSREIGIAASVCEGVTVRPLSPDDDFDEVARLIYITDPYIYPYWFENNIDLGARVLREMISLDTLYNLKNITVAILDGRVAGIVVSRDCPFTEREEELYTAFSRAGIPADARTKYIYNSYYAKMGAAADGYYIANVATHPDFRKRGVGAALLQYVLRDLNHVTLEAVKDNIASWRLYQRFGFEIECEYPGVFDVPCYKMVYRRKSV